ncbi:hypothetical protein N9901_00090 [Flavobacteriaceae bacterium]|nr:hypothetical protein [Flavobacteriaceae bacterium]
MPNRLKLHQQKAFHKSFTAKADHWELVLKYQTNSKDDTIYLEKLKNE